MTRKRPKEARFEKHSLDELIPYPSQAEFFGDLPDEQLESLAKTIDERNLDNPIEVLGENRAGLPPLTIIKGHQRVRALRLRGNKRAEVFVRHDLFDASTEEIEFEFLSDNHHRRQESMLQQARVELRLFEIDVGKPRRKWDASDLASARERIAKRFDMSPRNASRYLNVLVTPREIQDAHEHGLPLNDAAQAGCLPMDVQQRIVEAMRAGKPAREAIREAVNEGRVPKQESRETMIHDYLRNLHEAVRKLLGGEPAPPKDLEAALHLLNEGTRLHVELKVELQQRNARANAALAELKQTLGRRATAGSPATAGTGKRAQLSG